MPASLSGPTGRMRWVITCLAGGIGGARFLLGLRDALADSGESITVIANTADDIRILGLQVCPDLDTLMYTLGGGISAERGWGREGESWHVKDELAAYGAGPEWFGLGDRDLATHLVRTHMLDAGYSLSQVTAALCERWSPGVHLMPMTDDRVETHVLLADADEPAGRRAVHFQQWWIQMRAQTAALGFVPVGADTASPAPGVLAAIDQARAVIIAPSNPVVSIGTILSIPGIRDALNATDAPIVGISPIVAGAPVRGMADACLAAIGVDTRADAVAAHYGARRDGGLLDGWILDDADAALASGVTAMGITAEVLPTVMSDATIARDVAVAALALAERVTS